MFKMPVFKNLSIFVLFQILTNVPLETSAMPTPHVRIAKDLTIALVSKGTKETEETAQVNCCLAVNDLENPQLYFSSYVFDAVADVVSDREIPSRSCESFLS